MIDQNDLLPELERLVIEERNKDPVWLELEKRVKCTISKHVGPVTVTESVPLGIDACDDVDDILSETVRIQSIETKRKTIAWLRDDSFSIDLYSDNDIDTYRLNNQKSKLVSKSEFLFDLVVPEAMHMFEPVDAIKSIESERFTSSVQHLLDPYFDVDDDGDGLTKSDIYLANIEDGAYGNVVVAGWRLPGNGTSYERCGKFATYGCGSSHHDGYVLSRFSHRCGKLSCPVCYPESTTKAALKLTDRVDELLVYEETEHNRTRKPLHLTVSLGNFQRDDYNTKDGMKRVYSELYNELKSVGVVGGAVIFHPFRFNKSTGMKESYFSPHFHIIGVGYVDTKAVVENHEKTGSVVKVITNNQTGKQVLDSYNDVFGVAKYLLTHAGIKEKFHAIRYFGHAGNRKFKAHVLLSNRKDVSEHGSELQSDIDDGDKTTELQSDVDDIRNKAFMTKSKSGEKTVDPDANIQCILVETNRNTLELKKIETKYPKFDEFDGYIRSVCNMVNGIDVGHEGDIEHIDNPAFTKSKSSYHLVIKPADQSIEKSKIPLILKIDPSMVLLCHLCHAKLRPVVPVDPGGHERELIIEALSEFDVPDPDTGRYPEQIVTRRGLFRYWNRIDDMYSGVLYYDTDGNFTIKHDFGYPVRCDRVEYTQTELMQYEFDCRVIDELRRLRDADEYVDRNEVYRSVADQVNEKFYPEMDVETKVLRSKMDVYWAKLS